MNKSEQREIRLKMLALMNSNPDWLLDEERVKTIQYLGSLLMDPPKAPLKGGDWLDFKRSDFLFYISEGYSSKQIAKAYNVGTITLLNWKKEQGLFGRTQSELLLEYEDEILKIRQNRKK